MKVNVKSITKDNFTFDLESNALVSNVKQEVCKLKDISDPGLVKLIYSGKILKDNEQTLQEIQYKEEDFMVIIIGKKKKNPVPVQKEVPVKQAVVEESSIVNVESENSFDVHHPQLSSDQIKQLNDVLENDQNVQAFLSQYPNMRDHLKDPEVLIELLRRVGHPLATEMPDLHQENNPKDGIQVVHVTPEDAETLTEIRNHIKTIVGEIPLTEMQINSLVYQGYTMMNKDKNATVEYLINQLMDNNL